VNAPDILSVQGLTTWLSTPSGVVAPVDDVSFSVRAGRTLGLVGESGSGKSMTCLSIMRLLPDNARNGGGRILFEGEDLLARSHSEMADIRGRLIGMVLQDPMTSLNPLFTVGNQIDEVFARHLGTPRADRRRLSVEAMTAVRIPAAAERARAYPHQFSGGMRQRVSIAMNIACAPKLLICDEPTTALDVTVQAQILSLLRTLQRETGVAIILVTHDLNNVARFCDDIAVMYAGRIVEQGPVADVFARPGHPYTQGLLDAMPSLARMAAGAADEPLAIIPGQTPSLAALPSGCRFEPRCPFAFDACRAEYPDWVRTPDGARKMACWKTERLS